MDISEIINTDFGSQIFAELLGFEPKDKQKVRLFDDSKTSQEVFYKKGGKLNFSHIYNFSSGESYTPVTAFARKRGLSNSEALFALKEKYLLNITETKYHPQKPMIQAKKKPTPSPLPSHQDFDYSLANRHKSNLVKFLRKLYPDDLLKKVLEMYNVGFSPKQNYDTIFWYKNNEGETLNYEKHMPYNCENGKRTKPDNSPPVFQKGESSLLGFFGEHLNGDKIYICESEKTAIICAITDLLNKKEHRTFWATGGKGLLLKRFENSTQNLEGKSFIIIPDVSGNKKDFLQWEQNCKALKEKGFDVTISKTLETHASQEQKSKKFDIADFLISEYLEDNYLNLSDETYLFYTGSKRPQKVADPTEYYLYFYNWFKDSNKEFADFYRFILINGSKEQAKERLEKEKRIAIENNYPIDKLNKWLSWIENPENLLFLKTH